MTVTLGVRAAWPVATVLWALMPQAVSAQSPQLSCANLPPDQSRRTCDRSASGGDGATWGNCALVYGDAGGASVDYGDTSYSNGNDFSFTAVGVTSPVLWRGLAVYDIALSQRAEDLGHGVSIGALCWARE